MVLFWQKNADFFEKNTDISKIKWALILKGIFTETKYECVLFKFSVSSITLTDFREGEGVILHLPLTQNESLKRPPRLGLTILEKIKKKKTGLKFSQESVKDREDSKLSRGKIE